MDESREATGHGRFLVGTGARARARVTQPMRGFGFFLTTTTS
jgi:hypothetical protein